MTNQAVFLDFETRCQLDLPKVGLYNYINHPTFSVLCMSYAVDDYGVVCLKDTDSIVRDLRHLIKSNCKFVAHNAVFEISVISKLINVSIQTLVNMFDCTMEIAMAYNHGNSLDDSAINLNCNYNKDKEGKKTMLELSKKNVAYEGNEHLYQKLYDYCDQDVETTRELYNRLPKLTKQEYSMCKITRLMNLNGVRFNKTLVKKLTDDYEKVKSDTTNEIKRATNGKVSNLNSHLSIKKFILDNTGDGEILDLGISDIVAMKDRFNPLIQQVLEAREMFSKSSVAKLKKVLDLCDEDGVIRHNYIYCGASTGRFTGRTVQLQNLPRGSIKITPEHLSKYTYDNVSINEMARMYDVNTGEFAKSIIRNCVQAKDGYTFIIFDFSSIEARLLADFCNHKELVQNFVDNKPIYEIQASKVFKKPLESITKDSVERFIGKELVLSAGYGASAKSFYETCLRAGLDYDLTDCKRFVSQYRRDNQDIVKTWYNVDKMFRNAYSENSSSKVVENSRYKNVCMKLPSGRDLVFRDVKIASDSIQVANMYTYGGKIVQNIVQAMARDVLVHKIVGIKEEIGIVPCMTTHDEVCYMVKENEIDKLYAWVEDILEDDIEWVTSGLLKVEGYTTKFYRK